MKKRVLLVACISILVISLFLSACGGPSASTPANTNTAPQVTSTPTQAAAPSIKPITLRYSCALPMNHHILQTMVWEKQEIERRTNGAVTVEIYPDGEIFDHNGLVDALSMGAVDMGINGIGHWEGKNVLVGFQGLLFLLYSNDTWLKVKDDLRPIFESMYNKENVYFRHWVNFGECGLATKQPVNTPGDMKGLKIRAPVRALLDGLGALGSAPVQIAVAEVYDALAKGALDGVAVAWSSMNSRRFYEVTDYFTGPWWMGIYASYVSMNTWNKLPDEVKQILNEVSIEAEKRTDEDQKLDDTNCINVLTQNGTLNLLTDEQISQWAKTQESVWAAWVESCDKAGCGDEARQIISIIEGAR